MAIELISRIDSGSFADVWKAIDSLGRTVAVKIVRHASLDISSTLDHARALARTNHPNVVIVHSIEKISNPSNGEETDCVVMEYIDGPTLDKRLLGSKFSLNEVRNIGTQLIDGLEHIHIQGLAHGDFHTANILIGPSSLKIIDILYLDTLAILASEAKVAKIRRDLVKLRLILQEIMHHSEVSLSILTEFTNELNSDSDIEQIRNSFLKATDKGIKVGKRKLVRLAIKRLSEEEFVGGVEYAVALLEETPEEIYYDLFAAILKTSGLNTRCGIYIEMLWSKLDKFEQGNIVSLLKTHLYKEVPSGDWLPSMRILDLLHPEIWPMLSPTVQVKIEKSITNDILTGRHDPITQLSSGGALGTHANKLWKHFAKKDFLFSNIESMLLQANPNQNYVGRYLITIFGMVAVELNEEGRAITAIKFALKSRARSVMRNLKRLPPSWKVHFPEFQ